MGGIVRWVVRWRTPLVVVPLIVAVAVAGRVGVEMMTSKLPSATAEVACWDGGTAASAADCPRPTGAEGLQWVFPGFRPDDDRCRDVLVERPEISRPAMWECVLVVDGRRVTVTYMQLAGVESARRFFDQQFAPRPRAEVATAEGELARYLWQRDSARARSELATMYAEHPYAVGIRAPSARLLTAALRTIGFRHPNRISVADAET
jgi:hypothetical protein